MDWHQHETNSCLFIDNGFGFNSQKLTSTFPNQRHGQGEEDNWWRPLLPEINGQLLLLPYIVTASPPHVVQTWTHGRWHRMWVEVTGFLFMPDSSGNAVLCRFIDKNGQSIFVPLHKTEQLLKVQTASVDIHTVRQVATDWVIQGSHVQHRIRLSVARLFNR